MELYCGNDLHSTNNVNALTDEADKVVSMKRLPNQLEVILDYLEPYRASIKGVVVESTYNWYWLVDGLQEAGYPVHLANPAANKQYSGLKHSGDKSDSRWLAHLLRVKLLREGYICPKEARAHRDLLRKRHQLVRQQTANLLSLSNILTRNTGKRFKSATLKKLGQAELDPLLKNADQVLAAQSNLAVLGCLGEQIRHLEKVLQERMKGNEDYKRLLTVPGIGFILGQTILLETGDIKRFAGVGNFVSYCRCCESKKESNGKRKGEGNRKNGNKFLCWAFLEAANFATRYNGEVRRYYQRKLSKTKRVVALKAVANKLARACYYILRDGVVFDIKRAFV